MGKVLPKHLYKVDKVNKNMKVSPKHLYLVDKVNKIYESIIKTPVHSGQGTCTESITMQFPRFKNKPGVILIFL